MLRCNGVKVSLRTCSIFYALTLAFNVILCVFLYREMTSLSSSSPSQHSQHPSCSCPTLPPPSVVVPGNVQCATPPNKPLTGSDQQYLLVVMVLSSPKGRERRDTIRKTWMKGKRANVLIKFALGTQNLPSADLTDINNEEDTNHDLLLLPDLQDSYSNLTRKVLESFKALDASIQFSYLLKCDDDTFILLDEVLGELTERISKRSFYWGFFDGRAHVKRQGKWSETGWFLCDRYLPYALGGGYVLSHDLVRRIVSNSDGLSLYNSEDVSVGVWLSPYDAERRHDVRFNTEFVSRGCRNSYIVSHKQSVQDMLAKQHSLESAG